MTANLRQRQISILIGGVQFQGFVESFVTGFTPITVDGVCYTEAKLDLKVSKAFPVNPSYRLNPTSWRKGQTVVVTVANDSGTLAAIPCGVLFILETPKLPQQYGKGMILSLTLGCRLKLWADREPDIVPINQKPF